MALSLRSLAAWNIAGWVARAAHVAGGSRGRKLRRRALALQARLEPIAIAWYDRSSPKGGR